MTSRGRTIRLFIVGSACAAATLLLWARLVQVQIVRHKNYVATAQKQLEDPRKVPAARGGIFDRNGRPLALSARLHSVSIDPARIPNRSVVEKKTASILGLSRSDVRTKLRSKRNFVWLARQVALSDDDLEALSELRGVEVHREAGRVYPYGGVASKLVGFVGYDNEGRAGIEAAFEQQLSGTPGKAVYIRNGAYRSDRYYQLVKERPVDGKHVYLTIDAEVQEIAELELADAVDRYDAKSGAVIVMEVATGEILALAEYPYVVDRSRTQRTDSLWTVRSVSHVYEPGSTFKLITAAALLESGEVAPVDSFDAEQGKANLGFARIRDPHPHGVISFREAFAYSSNIVMAKASRMLKSEQFYRQIRIFNFGEKTGIRMMGESPGHVPEVADWSGRTKGTMAFGQEVAVTPLQMLNAFAAVANDGQMMMPRIVKGFADPGTGEVERYKPVKVRRVVGKRTARTLRAFCDDVVTSGTGTAAAVDMISVSGKTGTAQKAVNGAYLANRYIASFVGYAPSDAPRIACLVLLDEPRWSARYGGDSAAPVFSRVCAQIANSTDYFDGALESEVIAAADFSESKHIAPNFLRMERAAALKHAREIGVNVLCHGDDGRVVSQEPSPGVAMDRDGVLRLFVTGGSDSDPVRMPDLRGLSMRSAKLTAARSGLIVDFVGAGTVQRQNPAPGALVSRSVRLYGDGGDRRNAGGSR